MKKGFLSLIYLPFILQISFASETISNRVEIKLKVKTVDVGMCTLIEIVSGDIMKKGEISTFVFKTTGGVKLFSDEKCIKELEGIGQIKTGQTLSYYMRVDVVGKFSISLVSLGKDKWIASSVVLSKKIDELIEKSKQAQLDAVKQFQENKRLSDEDVVDLENPDGEIKTIAYPNLKLELHMDNRYYVNKCSGPINILIPNIHHIVRGNQFARFEIEGTSKSEYFIDDKCEKKITDIRFDKLKPIYSIYFKGIFQGKAFVDLTNKGRKMAHVEFTFLESPKEYNEEDEIIKFEKQLSQQYFYTNILSNVSEEEKERYKKMYDNYENAKRNKQEYYKDILRGLFSIFGHQD